MPDTTLRLNAAALEWAVDDDEVVALDLERVRYVGVNRSGAALWQLLARGTTRTELVELLRADYDLDPEQAERDVDAFLEACAERGYLA